MSQQRWVNTKLEYGLELTSLISGRSSSNRNRNSQGESRADNHLLLLCWEAIQIEEIRRRGTPQSATEKAKEQSVAFH
jgi:hypothetical protein